MSKRKRQPNSFDDLERQLQKANIIDSIVLGVIILIMGFMILHNLFIG
jgi:hypothetical protein